MTMETPIPRLGLVLGAVLLLNSCALEDSADLPTGATGVSTASDGAQASSSGIATANGIAAPIISSPLPGAVFPTAQPVLSVENVGRSDRGATLTYEFQVGTNDSFGNVPSQATGVAEGSAGKTAWQVSAPLSPSQYFWRARAVGPQGPGPYSAISDFTIHAGGVPPSAPSPAPGGPSGPSGPSSPAPPPSASEIFDPLTTGGSVGQVFGGRFTGAGWQVRSRGDFIRYSVSPISSGFVQWENLGLTRRNPQRDLYSLLGMWDPTRGDYRENAFRVHVRKLDDNGHNPPTVRLRFISNGDQHDVGWDFHDWNPSQTYRWRLEWGPTGSGNEARLILDGRVVTRTGYGPQYRPNTHWIELGIEERAESIIGVVYRNVSIGRR